LDAGRTLALEGPSGCGKSTLLNVIAGLLPVDEGVVWVDGVDITTLTEPARDRHRAQRVGYVFQTFNLLQPLTVLENVLLAQGFAGRRDEPFARALLAEVGLSEHLDHRPRQLSSGQAQRVALVRALVNRPSLVLADEPTASLDPARAREAAGLLRRLCAENGAALLLVSHSPEVLADFPDRRRFEELS
jgi:putative ABC transport system ATP-binding protein